MHISQLYIYPIKSLRATPIKEGTLSSLGLHHDRRFMLLKVETEDVDVDADADAGPNAETKSETKSKPMRKLKNMHVPHFPEMALFETAVTLPSEGTKGSIRVTYHPPSTAATAGKDENANDGNANANNVNVNAETETGKEAQRYLDIPLQPDETSLPRIPVTMHQSPTVGYDMGSKYNDWFSECFGYPVVLAYLGGNTRGVLGTLGPVKMKEKMMKNLKKKRGGGMIEGVGMIRERILLTGLIVAVCVSGVSVLREWGGEDGHGGFGHGYGYGYGISLSEVPTSLRGVPAIAIGILVLFLCLFYGVAMRIYGMMAGSDSDPDRITFADCAPFLIISETSVDDVSARLPADSPMDRTKFRPNIVVSGAETAFEEDFWSELAIGTGTGTGDTSARVRLLLTGNCVRCQSLNVDYDTGKMGAGESGTVLKKLMKDRRVDKGARFSPVFGRYSFLEKGFDGVQVRVGDSVEVVKRGSERTTLDWPGLTN